MNAIKILVCALATLAICFAIQAAKTARAEGWGDWSYVGDPCKHRHGIQQMHPVLGGGDHHTERDVYVACNDGSIWRSREVSP